MPAGWPAHSPTGATRWRSRRVRPTTPTATAATPTPPARMRNDRRDQSGITATEPPADELGSRAPDPSSSQPRTHRPTPIETAAAAAAIARVGERIAERGQESDRPRRRRTRRPRSRYRRRATSPSPAPTTSATATMKSSSASLSLVPNRATTRSFAPAGWRSMTTCPTAATSEVAPGNSPASSSERPSAAADGDDPCDGSASVRPESQGTRTRGRGRGSGRAHAGIIVARCDDSRVASAPRLARPAVHDDRQAERPAQDVAAQDGVDAVRRTIAARRP